MFMSGVHLVLQETQKMSEQCYGVDEQTDSQTEITTLSIDTEKQKSLPKSQEKNQSALVDVIFS